MSLARGSAFQFGVNIVRTVAGAFSILYVSTVLGTSAMGGYFLAMAIVYWLLVPSGGFREAVMKRMSEGVDREQFFTAGVVASTVTSVFVGVMILLVPDRINSFVGADLAGFVAGTFATRSLSLTAVNAVRGDGQIERAAALDGGRTVVRAATQVGLVIGPFGVEGLLIGEIVGDVVVILASGAILQPMYRRPERSHFASTWEYAKYSWFGNLKGNAYVWTDTLILGVFISPAAVGVYEIAWRVSELFVLLPAAVGTAVFPSVSRNVKEGNRESARRIVQKGLSIAPALAVPGFVGAVVIGKDVLGLYGPGFESGALVLIVLSAGRIVESYERLFVQFLNAIDLPNVAFRSQAVFLMVNIGLNVVLVSQFGTLGAAIATVISVVVSAGLAGTYLNSRLKISVSHRILVVQCVSATIMGIIVYLLSVQWALSSAVATISRVGVGATVYVVLLVLLSDYIRRLLRQVIDESGFH